MKFWIFITFVCLLPVVCRGELSVRVAAPTVIGSKAVVGLELKNGWTQSVESARATLMLLDEQGHLVGQSSKWVIGGSEQTPGLAANGTKIV
jgi:hypothetical protein